MRFTRPRLLPVRTSRVRAEHRSGNTGGHGLFIVFLVAVFSANALLYGSTDSLAVPMPDSAAAIQQAAGQSDSDEVQEGEFQEDVDTIVESPAVDTFAWDNWKINSGHFDSENWNDTVRLVLEDSAAGRFYVHPFKNVVTSNFGLRHRLWHQGVDIRLAKGDTVRAAFDGIVRVTKRDRRGYGKVVVIRHPAGLETIYGHLSRECVIANDTVKAGDVIGLGGSTGRSTGCHLHFEMRYYGEPFDPNDAIDFSLYTLKSDTLVLTKSTFAYLAELRKIKWHVIARGENLGRIARQYHTTVRTLCALNHITARTLLRTGRKIMISGRLPGT
jgi:murein DD-endopeptidase MepM/ murein hydrolase activator NlpD